MATTTATTKQKKAPVKNTSLTAQMATKEKMTLDDDHDHEGIDEQLHEEDVQDDYNHYDGEDEDGDDEENVADDLDREYDDVDENDDKEVEEEDVDVGHG